MKKPTPQCEVGFSWGLERIWTAVHGFADHCLTARPPDPIFWSAQRYWNEKSEQHKIDFFSPFLPKTFLIYLKISPTSQELALIYAALDSLKASISLHRRTKINLKKSLNTNSPVWPLFNSESKLDKSHLKSDSWPNRTLILALISATYE